MHEPDHVAVGETRGLPMTRNELVRREGCEAAARRETRGDNPYRPGSADWRAWVEGYDLRRG